MAGRENVERLTDAELQRFAAKIERLPDGCWRWTAALSTGGYGAFWLRGVQRPAHKVAFIHYRGSIPASLQLDHKCRNRACVRPSHLEPVTGAENVRRGDGPRLTRERHARRDRCPAGHAYTPKNTYRTATGARVCRRCHRDRSRAWRKQRAA